MSALRRTTIAVALAAAIPVALGACSSSGGKQESASTAGGGAGVADTPSMTVAMITHQAPGDTFWDIIRKGAEAAAKKDNVKLEYTADPDATKQAQLIQAAIDKKVDGIAVTDPNTGAIGPAIKKAVAAGIPVTMFNAGGPDAMGLGALGSSARARSTPARPSASASSRTARRTPSVSSRSRVSSSSRTAARA